MNLPIRFTSCRKLGICLLGFLFPLISLTKTVGSFELSAYMAMLSVMGIFCIFQSGKLSISMHWGERAALVLIFLIFCSVLYGENPARAVSKGLKLLVLCVMFGFAKAVFRHRGEYLRVFMEAAKYALAAYLLYLIYQYVVVHGLAYIGMDTVSFGKQGRNSLALVLVCVIPYHIGQLLKSRKFTFRLVMDYLCMLVLMVGLLLLQSRGALIAIVGSVCIILLREHKARQYLKVIAAAALVCAVFLLVVPENLKQQVFQRLLSIFEVFDSDLDVSEGVASTDIRKELIGIALGLFRKSPILGVGFGSFIKHNIWSYTGPHNDYLLFLSELGIIGFALYAFIMFWFANRAFRSYRATKADAWRGLSYCAYALVIYAVFMNMYDSVLLWTIFAAISVPTNTYPCGKGAKC